ncbi:hypothetical protein BCR41DRAFT_136468 [Lobosporangium transversale]|uniref:Uncharacterized protein n=1 Tax=Lobosporangium transversale TaxID=64571 RepID=A0A1Y2GG34_9FUNG|nr:hypothetical protein BCR41DRAFT_136468 [Lobosporangium transversale]ORZ09769.1 hypothetical protein BCR41DRAFT_136468 [Lobosporangium transversale]|eukprot:XP_021879039.1 hypothetical protein BCR41DRAFT_136468 [Lobosporangium transversale]
MCTRTRKLFNLWGVAKMPNQLYLLSLFIISLFMRFFIFIFWTSCTVCFRLHYRCPNHIYYLACLIVLAFLKIERLFRKMGRCA